MSFDGKFVFLRKKQIYRCSYWHFQLFSKHVRNDPVGYYFTVLLPVHAILLPASYVVTVRTVNQKAQHENNIEIWQHVTKPTR